MESFTRAVKIVLKNSEVRDGGNYRPEAALWDMAVRSCGYIQSRQAVSAGPVARSQWLQQCACGPGPLLDRPA